MTLLALCLFSLLALIAALMPAHRGRKLRRRRSRPVSVPSVPASCFPCRKPDWVRDAVMDLHRQHRLCSHRKLADLFNQLYVAKTGMSVGRTWVRAFLQRQAYEALQMRCMLKHRVPPALPANRLWGVDTTQFVDRDGNAHIVLAMVDYGSRLNVGLRCLRRFNRFTLAGALLLAFGEFGVPKSLKLDNHPVHHAEGFKRRMRRLGVRLRFTAPASPWQNGRVERLIGTIKGWLAEHALPDGSQVDAALARFRAWYNLARPHQHLNGCTPLQIWCGVNPYAKPAQPVRSFSAWDRRLRRMVLRR